MSPLSKNVKSAYLNVFISHKDAGRRINNRGMKLTFCYLFVWDDFVFTLELKWLAVKTFDCSLADSFFFFFPLQVSLRFAVKGLSLMGLDNCFLPASCIHPGPPSVLASFPFRRQPHKMNTRSHA